VTFTVPVWNGKWPIKDLLTIALCSVWCAPTVWCTRRHGRLIACQMKVQRLLGPFGLLKDPLDAMEWYPSIFWAHYNFETPRPHFWFVRERFERILELWLYRFDLCALLFACVRGVAAIVLLCAFLLPSLLWFDWDHLCKAWETPLCGDSSQ
jgi:hypothetical protein